MLYVLLYFAPDVLHDETAIMREIVDKHFVDNWVVYYVTGHTVDLTIQWAKYPVRPSLSINSTTHYKGHQHTHRIALKWAEA
jgi:WASH complex subunit strumpellin